MKTLILALIGAALPPALASSATALRPEVTCDLKMVEEVRISPDGRQVVYIQTDETAGPDGKNLELWLVNVSGDPVPRRLLPDNARVNYARWSPGGQLAVVAQAKDAPRRRQLLLLDPAAGTTRVLLDRFDGDGLEWSPDGRRLGFLKSEPVEAASSRQPGGPIVVGREESVGRVSATRFQVVAADGGKVEALTPASHSLTDYAWSPRGDAIVGAARVLGPERRNVVAIFPLAGGAPRERWEFDEQTIGLAWSPDGKTLAWCGREFKPGTGQLVLMAAEGDPAPRTVQRDFPGSLHNIAFLADGRLAFGALENLRVGIYSVAGDGSDLRADHAASSFAPGSLGVGSFTKFTVSFSADGHQVASMVSGPREPANVIAGPWGGRLTRRTALNPEIADLTLGEVSEISWRSFDGLEIHGFLVKPPGFDPAKRYPLVVEVHGGPRRSWWATCFLNNANWSQWIAAQGYVVLMPNPRGSEGRGADFVRANRKDLGGGDWRDIVAGLDHVARENFIDPDRLAIVGWSYGGYLTAWGITQPEGRRFKAAVIGAGITNILAGGGAAGGWADNHWGDRLAAYRQPAEFFLRSPIAHAANVSAATLILHGDKDTKVPHPQALEFHEALRELGVTTEARIYPGEGHGITRREHRIDVLESIARWLRTHVPPGAN